MLLAFFLFASPLGSTLVQAPARAQAQANGLYLRGWGGFIVKYDGYGRYSESLTKEYVLELVSELANEGYNTIRAQSRPDFLSPGEGSRLHYPILDLLISESFKNNVTVIVDAIHDFPPEEESYTIQSHYSSWVAVLKEVGLRYNNRSNVILECINEYILSDAYTKFQRIVTDLRDAGITLPLHFNYMWNSVGELRPLTDPLNKVSVGHHVYGNHDNDWRKPYSGESWLSYCKRIGLESTLTKMFTSSEKVWFGYPLSQGRAVMCTEVGASIRYKYTPWNIAYVMRLLEYGEKYGVGVACFRTGDLHDKEVYDAKAMEYFGRAFYIPTNKPEGPAPEPAPEPTPSPQPSTDIFIEDFENMSFSAWTSTYTSSGDFASVNTVSVYAGSYGAEFRTNGGGGYEYSQARKTIGAVSEVYMRSHIMAASNGMKDSGDKLYFLSLLADGNNVLLAGWRQTSSGLRWQLLFRQGTSYYSAYSSWAPIPNTWYCVEAYWLKSGSNGIATLWVDGVSTINVTGRDTDNYGDVTQVRFGIAEGYNLASTTIYGDDVIVSNKYIGPV